MTLNFHYDPSKNYGDEFFNYIMQNPEIFKMVFSPYNTGELRYKINNMIEGVFRLIQTEKNALEITDKELDYFSAFWSSGCIAVIEKWVQKDFSPSKDHIIKTLTEFEQQMEDFIASQLGLAR